MQAVEYVTEVYKLYFICCSVEGPLIEIVSPGNYGAATTVSYFHLRPYYNVIREWWSRYLVIDNIEQLHFVVF
jgi:hypothetical protein